MGQHNTMFQLLEMPANERAELLKRLRWCEDFNSDETLVLAKVMDLFKVSQDTTIFRQGAKRLFMCLIVSGEVEILREDFRHEHRQLAVVRHDQTLGEMSLIDGQPRSASAVTTTETVMFVLTKEKFDLLAEQTPRIWGKLLLKMCLMMSERLRQTSGELVDFLSYLQAVKDGEPEGEEGEVPQTD